ncbi:AlpA family phage regulatory protein [Caballeronia sp. LjRoot29]|uniref:helix-turn-helix transcriptional regulator n=1 Tax=Caballeronia sp. LjRoot29 TaxID=3342315 RepID=UPI003ECE8228
MTDTPIVRLPELMKLVCLCKGSIYRGVKSGSFPAPVKLSQRAVGWRRGDVIDWIDSRQKAQQ